MNNTLIQIERDVIALEQLIIEAEGEITPIVEQWMGEISKNLVNKGAAYAWMIDKFQALELINRERAEEYTQRARKWKSSYEHMKLRIKETMLNLDKKEIDSGETNIKLTRTAPVLELLEKDLPQSYWIKIETMEVNKAKIKTDLATGKEVPGARLRENYALRIRMEAK